MRALLLVALVACGRGGGDSEPASRPISPGDAAVKPGPAKPLTAAEQVAAVRACAEHFDARDQEKLAACYAEAATASLVGGPVTASGNQQVVDQLARAWWTGFPDLKVSPQLIVGSSAAVVSVDLLTGNNRGAFLGQPSTQKPIGLMSARLLQLSPTGEVTDEQFFVDEATLRGQLGDPTLYVRPVIPQGAPEPRVVAASGQAAEKEVAAALGKLDVALNEHAVAALVAGFAADAVITDLSEPRDARGKKEIGEYYRRLLAAFPDLHTTRIGLWAAGAWAVQVVDLIGTNDGVWPEMNIRKPTKRTVRLRQLQLAETRQGAVVALWTFANGLSLRIQLGLIPDPSTAAPPEDEDEAPQ
jgi:ketosteroid isomerase-like protein